MDKIRYLNRKKKKKKPLVKEDILPAKEWQLDWHQKNIL